MRIYVLFYLSYAICLSAKIDWPNFGGPFRNQVSNESGLRLDWKNEEPAKLWSFDVGLGYSSVIESSGYCYTQGYKDGRNTLYCLDLVNGKLKWKHSYPCSKDPKYFDGGSRATPSIREDKIYVCSHEGALYALDSLSGKIIWTKNIIKDFDGKRPMWGFSGSPLLVDNKIILETGSSNGSLICLNSLNGDLIWKSGDSEAGYASPILYGEKSDQIVVFNNFGVLIHNIENGEVLKRYSHSTRYGINAAQPIIMGDKIFISSAYGKGAAFVNFAPRLPSSIWESESFSCQMASLVRKGKFGYGIHGQAGARSEQSKFFCLDLETGREKWSVKGYGLGTVILVQDTLVILSDTGELSLASSNPHSFTELVRFQVLSGKTNWTPPTYIKGKMLCRSSKGKLVCLQMGNNK